MPKVEGRWGERKEEGVQKCNFTEILYLFLNMCVEREISCMLIAAPLFLNLDGYLPPPLVQPLVQDKLSMAYKVVFVTRKCYRKY